MRCLSKLRVNLVAIYQSRAGIVLFIIKSTAICYKDDVVQITTIFLISGQYNLHNASTLMLHRSISSLLFKSV